MYLLNAWISNITWKSLAYLFPSPTPRILFRVQSYSLIVISSWSLQRDHLLHSRSCFDWPLVRDALPHCPLGLEVKYCSGAYCHRSYPHRVFHIDDSHPPRDGRKTSTFFLTFWMQGKWRRRQCWHGRRVMAKAKEGKGQCGSFSRTFCPYGCPYFSTDM